MQAPNEKNQDVYNVASKVAQFQPSSFLTSLACSIILWPHAPLSLTVELVWRKKVLINQCQRYEIISSCLACVRRVMDARGDMLSTREAGVARGYSRVRLLRFSDA